MTTWQKEVIRLPDALPTRVPSSAHAIRFGPIVFVTGQSGRRRAADGPEYSDDPVEQARQCLDNIGRILEGAGTSFENVLKRTIFIRDRREYDAIRPVIDEYFTSPVASTIVETGLLRDEHKAIEIEVIAGIPEAGADGAGA
jgi:2-iminobutanoate/2-iminopropanoate deaminase